MERLKILVVDDESRMRKLIKDFLVKSGYEVLEAEDGEKAVDLFLAVKDIALIILDVMMPKINGYKISRLLKYDNKYKDIPIIMVTARSQEQDKLIGEETGVNEYISKPFELEEILAVVKKYLD